MSFTTKLKTLLSKPAQSGKERTLWFVGLYLAAVVAILVVSTALHLLVAGLSLIRF